MSATTHDFGRWVAEQSDEEAVTGEWTIRDDEGGLIAEVPNPYVTYEQQVAYAQHDSCPLEAYARLIAAAPDMLAALRDIVSTVHPNTGGTQGAIRDWAKAAIAKTGAAA